MVAVSNNPLELLPIDYQKCIELFIDEFYPLLIAGTLNGDCEFLFLLLACYHLRLAEIEKKYGFKEDEDFNLISKLYALPAKLELYRRQTQNMSRLKDEKNNVLALIESTRELRGCLRKTPTSIKVRIEKARKNTDNILYQSYISRLESDLKTLYDDCCVAILDIPKDKGGRTPNSLIKPMMYQLVIIFHLGTGKMPKCGRSEDKGKFVGKFYDFLLAIKPLLEALLDVELKNNESLGNYAGEAIRKYKKEHSETQNDSDIVDALLS